MKWLRRISPASGAVQAAAERRERKRQRRLGSYRQGRGVWKSQQLLAAADAKQLRAGVQRSGARVVVVDSEQVKQAAAEVTAAD
jgi:hypothetical protein